MKHKFTLGAVAGASALIVAVPLLSQFAGAASSTSAQAAISQTAAEQTALAAHPGKISESTKNDSHFGGYKIEINGNDGKEYDVIVDATTGKVSDSWVDGQDGPRHGHDKNDVNEQDQNDANEANDQETNDDGPTASSAAQVAPATSSAQ